jgi:hypothetical protein
LPPVRPLKKPEAPPTPKNEDKLYRFVLTGKGKGNHKLTFDVVARDGKAAVRLAREIISHHVLKVEEMT